MFYHMSYHMMNYHNLDHMSCLMFSFLPNKVPHVPSHVVPHGLPHAVRYLKLIYSHARIHKGNLNFIHQLPIVTIQSGVCATMDAPVRSDRPTKRRRTKNRVIREGDEATAEGFLITTAVRDTDDPWRKLQGILSGKTQPSTKTLCLTSPAHGIRMNRSTTACRMQASITTLRIINMVGPRRHNITTCRNLSAAFIHS